MSRFDSDSLVKRLGMLSVGHSIAFGACCCERLLPNYERFSTEYNWGNPEVLRAALNEIWSSLETGVHLQPDRMDSVEAECNKVIPDTEEFGTASASAALSAGAAVIEALECCSGTGEPARAAEAGRLATDAIYMRLLEESLARGDSTPESKIWEHPQMVPEIEKQEDVITDLRTKETLDPSFVWKLRSRSAFT